MNVQRRILLLWVALATTAARAALAMAIFVFLGARSWSAGDTAAVPPSNSCAMSGDSTASIQAADIVAKLTNHVPVRIDQSLISGDLNLAGLTIDGPLTITRSLVRGMVNFARSVFTADADFSGTCFEGEVHAESALFNGELLFPHAILKGPLSFYAVTAGKTLTFDDAVFMHDGGFSRVRVEDHLYFTRTHFRKTANFIGASVGFLGIFEGAVFDGDALFERAEFGAGLFFRPPEAGGPVPGAIFSHVADFKGTRVSGQAEFLDVTS